MNTSRVKTVKPLIKIAPVFLLAMDFLSLLMYTSTSRSWSFYHAYVQEPFFGHSVLLVVVCLYFAIRHKLCMYTIIALVGLLATNVYNSLLFLFLQYDEVKNSYYYSDVVTVYKFIIIIVFLCLSIVFLIKRK